MRAPRPTSKKFEQSKVQLEAQQPRDRAEAERMAETLDGQTFVVIRSASDGGALYGSVTTRDVATRRPRAASRSTASRSCS
jgi:large subunit ribosomal protein L9